MKKKLLLAIAAIAFLGACNKEKLNLTTENQSSNIEIEFKYHESIKVFDKTGTYFAEYSIKTNNLEEFTTNKTMLENSYIKLGFNSHPLKYKNYIPKTEKAQPIDYSKTLMVSINTLQIGEYNNFQLLSKDESRGLVVQSFSWWRYFLFEPNFDTYSISVACNWNGATATDYSIDYASQGNPVGSHIIQQQTVYIPSGGNYAFPPTGYLRHRIQLTNGYSSSTCTLFIYSW